MITNERGSTLLTVLIINLVLIILGMSIISSTIGSAKRTAMRDSEISITYGAMDAVDVFTTKLVQNLNSFGISKFFSNSDSYDSELFTEVLSKSKKEFLSDNSINQNMIECINLIDITGATPKYVFSPTNAESNKVGTCLRTDLASHKNYENAGLDLKDDLTRVYDLVITTKNPIETQGNIEKVVTKRMILSPLPSFLRYAVGSNSLYLNGSSNIVGNVFARNLKLENTANYTNKKNEKMITGENEFPSIIGNVYSTNAEILEKLKPKNFYKNTVPNLSHDSQFANIDFDKTFLYSIAKSFKDFKISTTEDNVADLFTNFSKQVITSINDKKSSTQSIPDGIEICTEEKDGVNVDIEGCYKTTPKFPHITESISIEGESITIGDIDNELTISNPIYVKGDLTIYAKEKLTIEGPIYVNGDVAIVAGSDLIIGNNNDFYVNGNVNLVASKNTTINSNLLTTGSISITNFDTDLEINGSIISGDKITITSNSQNPKAESSTKISGKLDNASDTKISTKINNGLISAKDTTITTENMKTIIKNNLFINGNFTISGNEEPTGTSENDDVLFKSVIYVNGQTTISNTNISTIDSTKDNLVLLSKGNLLLTRINEFRYYKNEKESKDYYLPIDSNNETETIKPIKGFFYTDSNAELYGVGSLFYVHGGIFAKDELVINAVRGKTAINQFSPLESKDKLSRFIVKYDDSILFNSLTSLPIVEHLQLIIDEQTVQ